MSAYSDRLYQEPRERQPHKEAKLDTPLFTHADAEALIAARLEARIKIEHAFMVDIVAEALAQEIGAVRNELKPGPQGPPGPQGKLCAAKPWQPDMVHYEGEVVGHDGSTYQARKDTGRAPTVAEDWTVIAAAGQAGRSIVSRGTFDAAAKYCHNDLVACGGASWLALHDGPGACPGDGWQLVASQGKRGVPGPQGERGERGPPGIDAPVIAGWKIDRESYTITPVLANGIALAPISLQARLVIGIPPVMAPLQIHLSNSP